MSAPSPQFFLTAPGSCPYLPGRQERRVFTSLPTERGEAKRLNTVLTQAGFRRSQGIVYRQACIGCRACVPLRVRVGAFRPSSNLRRVLTRNQDLQESILPISEHSLSELSLDSPELEENYALFRKYMEERHKGGRMAQMTREDYFHMFQPSFAESFLVLYKKGAQVLGIALTDVLEDGLSMVYSFFDPEQKRRSLGSFMILDHIQRSCALNLPYLYLGYWIAGTQKMAYKSRFKPQECLGPRGWVSVDAIPS